MSHIISPRKLSRKHVRGALRHMEVLEPRTLLSAVVSSYAIPDSVISSGAYDSQGNLWVYDAAAVYVHPVGSSTIGQGLERVVNGVVDASSVIPMDISQYLPYVVAMGSNDHMYVGDSVDAIDDVNLATGQIQQYTLPHKYTTQEDSPIAITVTGDGAVWFLAYGTASFITGTGGESIMHQNSIIGRFDPGTGLINEFYTGVNVEDSQASYLVAKGPDSVWVAMTALIYQTGIGVGFDGPGTNHIASVSYTPSDGIQMDHAWAVNTGDVKADNGNALDSIVDGGDGSIWFSLANSQYTPHPATMGPDQIVHGVISGGYLVQTAYILPGADVQTPLAVDGLAFGADGNLWFGEIEGPRNVGYLSPNGSYTFVANPSIGMPFRTAANADGTQLSMFTFLDNGDASAFPIVQVDITPQVTFSGSANDINIQEDKALASNTLLATFTAPTPASAYSAVITWGDNTTTTVAPTALGNNTYAILVSGKTFATQGAYNGSIAVKDGQSLTGTLTFVSHVGDIPLNVTSITATPIILRIVTAVGSFTDDGDLALSTWTATINWGDNTSSTGLIVRDPTQSGRYLVLAIHQYRTRGTYTVRMTVSTSEQLAAITRSTLATTVKAS